jgi:hypothetical protein
VIEKPLSAHWFLEARRLALKRRLSQAGWRRSDFSNNLNAPSDGARGLHFKLSAFYFDLVRVVAIFCDRPIVALARGLSDEDRQFMAQDQGDERGRSLTSMFPTSFMRGWSDRLRNRLRTQSGSSSFQAGC